MQVLVEALLQREVTLERTNRDFYRLGSFVLDNEGWGGFAKLFKKSSDDEQSHADGFAGFLVDRNIDPIYDSISKYEPHNGPLEYMNAAYEAEQKTTAAIEEIYKTAHDEGEFLVTQFLQFYLDEQCQSERDVWDIIQAMEASPSEWRLIDEKLGE